MIAALVVLAGVGGVVGALWVMGNAAVVPPPGLLATWASTRSAEREGDAYRAVVDGVPVSLVLGRELFASAVYPVGGGPAFELRAPAFEMTRRGIPASTIVFHDADSLVQAVHARYRKRGLATDALERVVTAIRRHVDRPVRAPSFTSDGSVVRVSVPASATLEPAAVDLLAALAASIASFDLAPLVTIADALSRRVEIGADGIAFVALAGRASVRITLSPAEPGARGLATRLSGTLEPDAADLLAEPRDLTAGDAGVVHGEAAAEALRALVALPDARVSLRPRGATVHFAGHPPIDRLRRAIEALEVLLSRGSESPFR